MVSRFWYHIWSTRERCCDVSVTVVWYPIASGLSNNTFSLEDTMNTKRNWTQVAVVVVLALASLSSTTSVAAVSAPHRARRTILAADLCGETFVSGFDQYMAATEWVEQGGPVPLALTVNCVENNLDLTASLADLSGDSGTRWEQYAAAIEGRELELNVASIPTVTGGPDAFDQYSAAIEWTERGGQVPQALTVSGGETSQDFTASHTDNGGDSWVRFEQYLAAIEGTELVLNAASVPTVMAGPNAFDQYSAAIEWTERSGQVPQALTVSGGEASLNLTFSPVDNGGDSWVRFEQYMDAINTTEY
jgi:hypothetical protein